MDLFHWDSAMINVAPNILHVASVVTALANLMTPWCLATPEIMMAIRTMISLVQDVVNGVGTATLAGQVIATTSLA